MNSNANHSWRINRQVDVSVLIQLVLLAGLIIGSWINLQRQLDLLRHDVGILLNDNKCFQQKLEQLTEEVIAHRYRLKALEKSSNNNISGQQD